jgi:PAS domain S-box-containing protein
VEELSQGLNLVQLLLFVALGLVAGVQWWRRRGAAAGWLAATFGVLGVVAIASELLPERSAAPAVVWARKLDVGLMVLFPYLLYRFMTSFVRPTSREHVAAAVLTGVAFAGALLLPDIPEQAEPRPTLLQLYIYLILVQWVWLSGLVALRLWRGGKDQPTLCRRRMRTLSLGSLGFALAVVAAGTMQSTQEVTAAQMAVELFAIAAGCSFFMGFAPPPGVRRAWRAPEEAEFREAQLALMEAESPAGVAAVLLPHVTQLVGGRGSVLIEASGQTIGSHGLSDQQTREIVEWLTRARRAGEASSSANSRLSIGLQAGWLVVEASVFTPYFGREETKMLQDLALPTELALERANLLLRERRSRAQLAEAQRIARIGSWEWDLTRNRVTWSEELYRIFGLNPQEFEPSHEAFMDLVHPDDRESVDAVTREALHAHDAFTHECRIVPPTGDTVVIQARGTVTVDDRGQPIKMIGTAQDVTERKRQESFREQFVANAAHELRTPLTALLGLTEVLSRGRQEMSEEQIREAFDGVTRAGDRLSALVGNLLDLTKLQQGEIRVTPEPVPLAPLSQQLVASMPAPEEVSIELRMDDGVVALADPQRLDQILSNLLTNAFRYGGPEVVLAAESDGSDVLVSVSDNGSGVEEALVPHLFDPFARGSASAGVGGSGLGLAIVQMLVEASGGDIWYEVPEPNGARFCIRLPQAPR